MVKLRPATCTLPVLNRPGLGCTLNFTALDPVMDVDPTGAMNCAPLEADHVHPVPVVTVIVNSPPAAASDAAGGSVRVKLQPDEVPLDDAV
jgi:hypothetical protein